MVDHAPPVPGTDLAPLALVKTAAGLATAFVVWAGAGAPAIAAPPEASDAGEQPEGPAPDDTPTNATDGPESATDPDATTADGPAPEMPRPPRVDGPFLGGMVSGTVSFPRVLDLDTPDPLAGFHITVRTGQEVLPWLTLGIEGGGGVAYSADQNLRHGGFLVEAGFLPVPRIPFSIRTGFGFGAGYVRDDAEPGKRFGYGGAMFKGGIRYEFFPVANRKRLTRGGGWAIGPELNWLGNTPNQPDGPMNHTIMLGLHTAFYWGD